jgi:hypothetical protein
MNDVERSGRDAGWSHGNYAEHVGGVDVGRLDYAAVAASVDVPGWVTDPEGWREWFAEGLQDFAEGNDSDGNPLDDGLQD